MVSVKRTFFPFYTLYISKIPTYSCHIFVSAIVSEIDTKIDILLQIGEKVISVLYNYIHGAGWVW